MPQQYTSFLVFYPSQRDREVAWNVEAHRRPLSQTQPLTPSHCTSGSNASVSICRFGCLSIDVDAHRVGIEDAILNVAADPHRNLVDGRNQTVSFVLGVGAHLGMFSVYPFDF
ncbi:unnamed protein product [Cyclocybe aegerita]|uniref:Uncharacterized protein n=1 Tax=Cyclocybe aegerita TaxID=1973307 RepID=A0A8S0VSA6_CYCAE|nr:unnamed protein product [Cyclocybe aegerita]